MAEPRKKRYAFSKVALKTWQKNKNNKLQNPTDIFFKRLKLNKIEVCTFKTYCYHGNTVRRILVNGEANLDIFLQREPEVIIQKMQEGLESTNSSYYRKLMDFIATYLSLNLEETQDENLKTNLETKLGSYRKHCFDLKINNQLHKEKNEKNQKEKDSWISYHRLQEVCENLISKVQTYEKPVIDDTVSKNQIYLQQLQNKKQRIQFQEAIMVSLYILNPPCRNDLMDLKYCLYDTEKDNYFHRNENGNSFIFLNHYKTYKTYGQCVVNIPLRIAKLINDFIDKFAPPSPYLFYNRQGNVYKESTFSSHITDIFLNQTNKHINIQTLRKIYATQNTFESVENSKNVAKQMGHSLETHYTYKKNNNGIDDDIRRFSFQKVTRQMYNPKFDGNDFFIFRAKILQKDPNIEINSIETSLKLIGIPEKICFEDYNDKNESQREFIQKFKSENPECEVVT